MCLLSVCRQVRHPFFDAYAVHAVQEVSHHLLAVRWKMSGGGGVLPHVAVRTVMNVDILAFLCDSGQCRCQHGFLEAQ